MEPRERLLRLLKEKAYKEGKFILVSGKESDFYIDCRPVTLHPEGAYLIGKLFFEKLREAAGRIQGVGGMTLGADPIATAVSLTSYLEGKPINAFLIRKEAKKHGRGLWVEGIQNLPEGTEVAIVEDVVTTGGSTLKAIDRAKEEGLKVSRVLAIVDREEGGRENLTSRGFELEALFSRSDFVGKN
ncbi:MAG TPA: orotate phosphoribosyltransferase [Thermodesulfobacteriota bacterium]|nr:orotate phosphoribosyltransferase [Thermodesulfobacteriota bacterium]